MEYDVFISYASEDEESFVAGLADLLTKFGVKVWFAPAVLKIGDSLSRSIDKGLANAKFGVVVLSKAYIAKPWPEYELKGLTSKAIGKDKVILPIWHGISRDEVLNFSPPLADTFAPDTSRISLYEIALKIIEIVRHDIFNNLMRLQAWEKLKSKGTPGIADPKDLKPGPIRHKSLPESFLIRAKLVQRTLADVLPMSLDKTINNFRRDFHPWEELVYWERMAAAYLDLTAGQNFGLEKRNEILSVLFAFSTGMMDKDKANKFQHLSYEEVTDVGRAYLNVVPKIVDLEDEAS
jgi:TIR domain